MKTGLGQKGRMTCPLTSVYVLTEHQINTHLQNDNRKINMWKWSDESAINSTGCSSKGSRFDSEDTHVDSIMSITEIPMNLLPFYGLCGPRKEIFLAHPLHFKGEDILGLKLIPESGNTES